MCINERFSPRGKINFHAAIFAQTEDRVYLVAWMSGEIEETFNRIFNGVALWKQLITKDEGTR